MGLRSADSVPHPAPTASAEKLNLPISEAGLQEGGSWAPSLGQLPGTAGLSPQVGGDLVSPDAVGWCFCWGACLDLRTQGSEVAYGHWPQPLLFPD